MERPQVLGDSETSVAKHAYVHSCSIHCNACVCTLMWYLLQCMHMYTHAVSVPIHAYVHSVSFPLHAHMHIHTRIYTTALQKTLQTCTKYHCKFIWYVLFSVWKRTHKYRSQGFVANISKMYYCMNFSPIHTVQ